MTQHHWAWLGMGLSMIQALTCPRCRGFLIREKDDHTVAVACSEHYLSLQNLSLGYKAGVSDSMRPSEGDGRRDQQHGGVREPQRVAAACIDSL